jgi:hypothetical protein
MSLREAKPIAPDASTERSESGRLVQGNDSRRDARCRFEQNGSLLRVNGET